jgi:hypothetical protein
VPSGLQDNVRLYRERLAPSSAALVRRVIEHRERHERPGSDTDAGALGRLPAAVRAV